MIIYSCEDFHFLLHLTGNEDSFAIASGCNMHINHFLKSLISELHSIICKELEVKLFEFPDDRQLRAVWAHFHILNPAEFVSIFLTFCELAFNIIPCVLNHIAIFKANQKDTFSIDVDVEDSGGSGEVEHGLVALVCACILVDVNVVVQAALHQQFVFAVGDSFLEEIAFTQSFIEIIALSWLFFVHVGCSVFFKIKQMVTLCMNINNLTWCICQLSF